MWLLTSGELAGDVCVLNEQQTLAPVGATTLGSISHSDAQAIAGWPSGTVEQPGGRAYAYHLKDGEWSEVQMLTASPAATVSDRFGHSVSVKGDTAIVGAPAQFFSPNSPPGNAYIFRLQNGIWVQEAWLTPADGGSVNDQFGLAVAVDGNVAVVGRVKPAPGAVYVYRFDGKQWNQEEKIVPPAPGTSGFGSAVAIDQDVVIVGALGLFGAGVHGSALVYRFDETSWVFEQQLSASDGSNADHFGTSISLNGDLVLIGAPDIDIPFSNCGAAYVFKFDGIWAQTQKLTKSDAAATDKFGSCVALSATQAAVSAPFDNGVIWSDSGSVDVFEFDGKQWSEHHRFATLTQSSGEMLGGSISISDDYLLATKPTGAKTFPAPSDCDANGVADFCDTPDCNHDRTPDACEIADGISSDCDFDGVIDQCQTPDAYVLDDGVAEQSWGVGNADFIWLNQFNVLEGHTSIDYVDIAWGDAPENTPAKVLIYADPNDDGNPSDATLLASVDASVRAFPWYHEIATLTRIRIPHTYIGEPGTSFFVGAYMQSPGMPGFPTTPLYYPATTDASQPNMSKSWWTTYFLGQADLSELGWNTMNLQNGDFLIRAMGNDCNGNGIADMCDIDGGASGDSDGNGIPDECEAVGRCKADIAPVGGDNSINVDDLLAVINNWGASGSSIADINGDQTVNVDDLLAVINGWGPCE